MLCRVSIEQVSRFMASFAYKCTFFVSNCKDSKSNKTKYFKHSKKKLELVQFAVITRKYNNEKGLKRYYT